MTAAGGHVASISAFVAAGRGNTIRYGRGGRGLSNKRSGCGSIDHILTSCTASDDALGKWTLAKNKLQKYGTPSGAAPTHAALLSDISHVDPHVPTSLAVPTPEECTDDYDDTEVNVPFSSVAFSSSLAPGRDLSHF
jgi:hypothetical protein